MDSVDTIRKNLINRISAINNKDFLKALDKLISNSLVEGSTHKLTKEQELMLALSEDDIINGRTIGQDELKSKTVEWVQKMEI